MFSTCGGHLWLPWLHTPTGFVCVGFFRTSSSSGTNEPSCMIAHMLHMPVFLKDSNVFANNFGWLACLLD